MNQEVDQLWKKLGETLKMYEHEETPIKRYELSRKAAVSAVNELEELVIQTEGDRASNPVDIIYYNRVLAPRFYAKLLYFYKCVALEYMKVSNRPDEHKRLYNHELNAIVLFFRKYLEFSKYWLSGSTDRDERYFLNWEDAPEPDDVPPAISPIVNRGCLLAAQVMAAQEYRAYIMACKEPGNKTAVVASNLTWLGSVSEANELAILLQGLIKKGDRLATIKELREWLGTQVNVNLSNGSQLDNKRRNRKDNSRSLVDVFVEKDRNRKEQLDEDQENRYGRG